MCMCTCVLLYVYVCVHVHVYVCVSVYVYVCMRARVRVCVLVHSSPDNSPFNESNWRRVSADRAEILEQAA